MESKANSTKKGGRKKLDNIISKLAEHQLNKTSKNEDKDTLSNETFETEDADVPITETTFESKRKSKRKPLKILKSTHQYNQQNDEQPESNLTVVKAFNSDEDIDEHVEENDFQDNVGEKTSKKKRKKSGTVSQETDDDLPRIVNCSACSKSIHTKTGKICRHPDLNTLICKNCNKFYSSGKFTKDEYGVEEFCRWCADGGDLICCDFCEKAFCKDCVKRNLGRSKLKELLEAGEDVQWNCFCCDPDPISSKILLCNRVMHLLDEKKDQHTPYRDTKGREIIRGPNTNERRNLLTNISGEQSARIEDTSETSFSKKNYSKRFQNGKCSTGKNGEDSKENVRVKKELGETDKDVTTVVSSEEESGGTKKQNRNQSKKRNKAGEKPNKLRGSRGKSDKEEETDNSSSDHIAHSRTKSRGKVRETKSSRNRKLKESDSDNDFVSMVKKSKKSREKERKKSKRGASSSEDESDNESDNESGEVESSKASGKKGSKSRRGKLLSSSNEDGNKSDSDDEVLIPLKRKTKRNIKTEKKERKPNKRWSLRKKGGESEETDSDAASDEETPKRKKRKNKKRKRNKIKKQNKRKRKLEEEEEEDTDEDDDDDENVSPSKRKGRKKIRKILDNEKLEEATKHARKLEEERRKRLVERTKNTTFEKPASVDLKEVVLEFEPDGETPLIKVDQDLVKHLKPHQVDGVKFMYDCTIESVQSWEKKEEQGGGCILGHVMGLGKTLQVVALVHTLYRSELIQLRRIMVVCPLNTVLNWQVEFEKWLSVDDRLDLYMLNEAGSKNWHRADMLKGWYTYGGVLIMGYTMYRNLSQCLRIKSKHQKKIFKESLVDPGPELVVCDEGHILRNCKSAISIAMNGIKTKRRVVLTGTPLQNNLMEYHCMVSFVKPSLLGTLNEFSNSFIHPIKNGQCADSTDIDVRLMKNRCHVLHKMLKGCVQRKDYADIAQFLPPKFEYVIKIRLSEKQREIYKYYLETFLTDGGLQGRGGSLFSDYQALMRIWTHPWCLKLESARQIERFIDTDDSMADFVVESEGEEEASASSEDMSWTSDSSENKNGGRPRIASSSGSSTSSKIDDSNRKESQETESLSCTTKDSTRIKLDPDEPCTSNSVVVVDDITEEKPTVADDITEEKPTVADEAINLESEKNDNSHISRTLRSGQELKEDEIPEEEEWYDKFLKEEDETNIELGSKLVLLLEILADAAALDEKVLVFSHSLVSLDVIEKALGGGEIGGNKVDWCRGCDYFRMDGSTSVQMRKRWSDIFNDEENKTARVFLISTKAGGLGINLIGASRVIVFDISWNPSHDVQSIFRAYRFGQNRPVFVYRFIAEGSMEEKIYDRQVTKLSVSQRVVDEHQIQRHFNAHDLAELYRFEPNILENVDAETPTLAIPKDPILAELINRLYPKWIVNYHEHDSLLRNRPEEELSEAERKEAWEHYEAEKQGLNNRMPFVQNDNVQNGVQNIGLLNTDILNAMNAGVGNLINPTSIPIRVPAPSVAATLAHLHPMVRPINTSQLQQLHKQQQQRVLEDQRRRLFEYERQRIEVEKRREKELREREVALCQMEIRRQEEIRARRAREHEVEEQRRQHMEVQQSRQFLQQLLHNQGGQNAYITQQRGPRGYPAVGQSTYRVVVNSAPGAQPPRRSPPRIIELPPDA